MAKKVKRKSKKKFEVGDWVKVLTDDFEPEIMKNGIYQIDSKYRKNKYRSDYYEIQDKNSDTWPYFADELEFSEKHKNFEKVKKYLGIK